MLRIMTLGRNGTLLMLIAVLFWTAAPAFACLSDSGTHAHDHCCAAMMQDCGPTMSGSCCQLAPTHNPPAVASEYAPEFAQQPGLLWRESFFPPVTDSARGQKILHAIPPHDPSLGLLSVLRI